MYHCGVWVFVLWGERMRNGRGMIELRLPRQEHPSVACGSAMPLLPPLLSTRLPTSVVHRLWGGHAFVACHEFTPLSRPFYPSGFALQVFTSASTVVFKTFACDEDAIEGESYLRADYSLSCDSDMHVIFMVYAGLMLCVSIATIVVCFVVVDFFFFCNYQKKVYLFDVLPKRGAP